MCPSPQAEKTRRRILDAARSEFAAGGFAATSTRAIAARAEVTQPLVHHYFGTKELLFEAVLEDAAVQYEHAQRKQFSLPLDGPRFLTRGLVVLFRWLGENREMMRLAAWARLEGRLPPGRHAVAVYGKVRDRLDIAVERGIVRPEVDADMLIAMIDASFKGFWDRLGVYREYPLRGDEKRLESRYLRQAMEVLFRGVLMEAALPTALAQMEDCLKE